MRTEVTYLERAPYRISSLLSRCMGGDGEPGAGEAGPWAAAGVRAPAVRPLASAAPPLRNSRRAGRFQAIGLSLLSPRRNAYRRSKYTPLRQQLFEELVDHAAARIDGLQPVCELRPAVAVGRDDV